MIDASSPIQDNNSNNYNNNYNNNNNSYQKMHGVTSVAIWETHGQVKIFTGSQDGFWRLWNFNGTSFLKEFENNMGGSVECLVVASNFLFCGFESVHPNLPDVAVGMVHAWNLSNPADQPLEFQMNPLMPYAHAQAVTNLLVVDGQKIVSGSKDGSIKLWTYDQATNHGKGGFILAQTLPGHARQITGLVVADSVLWSGSTDGAIRIWDMAKNGECQCAITSGEPLPNQQQPSQGQGHTNAVTSLCSYKSPTSGKTFILSGSLDGDVKAWDGATGQGLAKESHGEGVVSMSMAADSNGKPLLLVGTESGNIIARNLEPSGKVQQPFAPLITLSSHFSVGHSGAVKVVCQGPAGTFFSGGKDGKVFSFQFTGDLGL